MSQFDQAKEWCNNTKFNYERIKANYFLDLTDPKGLEIKNDRRKN